MNDLQKNVRWVWTPTCSEAVKTAKELLAHVLTHYDANLPLPEGNIQMLAQEIQKAA